MLGELGEPDISILAGSLSKAKIKPLIKIQLHVLYDHIFQVIILADEQFAAVCYLY